MTYCLHYIPRLEMYGSSDTEENAIKYKQLGYSPRQNLVTTSRAVQSHILWLMVGGMQ